MKRLLSMILTMCMVFTMIPSMVFAESAEKTATTKEIKQMAAEMADDVNLDAYKNNVSREGQKKTTIVEPTITKEAKTTYSNAQKALSHKKSSANTYVAELGDYVYTSLQAAVDDAVDGDTIYLIDNISLEGVIISDKDITIDFDDYYLGGTYSDAMMIIYNSEVTLRDGYIMNIGSGNGLAVLGTSDVLMDGMSFTTTAEDTSGVLVGEGSLTEFTDCMFLSGSILDITSEFVNGVYVADGGYATVDECLIIFDEGVGLLAGSGSEVDIYDTDILMEEAYGISANKNSSVFVSKGSYLARWALFSNGGDITIDTGIFESEYYGVPAISSNGSNFGTNITIQSGSLATPSNWRTTAQDAIAVYKNMNKPGNLKVNLSGSYNNIKATWNKVSGATGYAIYYKKGTGSYKFWGRTTKNTVTIKNLTAGAKYNVKVVPYKKCEGTYNTFYGEGNKYSTAYTYTLKKVTLSTFSKSGSKVKVKWKNISGETGYQISKSIKKTGTNIVSTYKTTTGTYKLVSATKGKTYYYKIRAYKTVNGSKIYGPWSNVKAYKR